MKTCLSLLLVILLLFLSCTAQDIDDKGITQRITYNDGLSNAFTDLVYFDNQFFLVYRESDKHVYGRNGIIKLLNSTNGKKWKLIKEYSVSGVDLRDPKFSVNNDELMLYIHGSTYVGKTISKLTDYRLKYSDNWNNVEAVILDNKLKTALKILGNEAWPWRVTWNNGKAYTIGYNGVDIFRLYESNDGLFFKSSATSYSNVALPTEATIAANDKGDLYVLSRRNNGSALFLKYNSEKNELKKLGEIPFTNFGGPNFLFLNEKKMIFVGSFGNVLVGVYDLETNQSKIIYNFGGGDCGYPGMLIKDNVLWISFYSSHQTKGEFSIYLAKIKLEDSL